MYAAPDNDRDRIDGLATFAAAAFLTGMGLVAALARVGAPDRLVEALGPLIALVGLTIIGTLTRTARLGDFLAARRAIPAAYAGLAFAATAGGLILAQQTGGSPEAALPAMEIALGLAIAALIFGPLVRSASASGVADVLATRFPWARWPYAIVLWSAGLLTAVAGLEAAVDLVVVHVGQNRRAAEILVAFALAMSVAPGGLKGLLWSDAASAGGALAIAAIGAALAWLGVGGALPFPATGWIAPPEAPADAAGFLYDAASVLGVGVFFAFAPPAIGVQSGRAPRAGLYGLAFCVLGFGLGAVCLAAFPRETSGAARSATSAALIGAATFLPTLALARAGVLGASRGLGVDLATAYARLSILASARIARTRLMMLAVVALAAYATDARIVDPARAIVVALAVNLAFVTPGLILAAVSRFRSPAAFASLAAALATLVRLGVGRSTPPRELLVAALVAGAVSLIAGFAVGALASWRFEAQRRTARADPFSDLPFETRD